ncbi:MAG: chitobiase/beta-hexosaminidase C-terminal domain-containing protein [Kiritimatiellae bacterium]|nr:chitobiase/beta-hexosaminidase C-terminal domain-containing protein [Kiritimatiellia bacterium]
MKTNLSFSPMKDMKTMKTRFDKFSASLITMALCGAAPMAADGASAATLRVDARTTAGARIATGVETRGSADGAAATAWNTTALADGWTTVSSGGVSTNVLVLNTTATVAGGRLAVDAACGGSVPVVVRDDVVVPADVTLSVAAGTVVKFTEGAKIVVEDGGALVADGVLFADFADDSVGGDTNMDGDGTAPTTVWDDWTEGIAEGDLLRVRFLDGNVEAFPARAYTAGRPLGALPEPSRAGARFDGWRTAPDGGGEAVSDTTVADAETAALHAQWTAFSLALAPASMNLTAAAQGVTLSVSANEAWTAVSADGWITLRTRRGSGDGTIGFSVLANDSTSPRTGTVRVTLAEGGLARDFTVVQGGMEAVAVPVVTPGDGTTFRASAQRVAIRCATSGAAIRYTLDGSDPTESSALYAGGGFNVFDTTTVKARAFKDGMLPSAVVSVRFVRLQTLAEALDVPLWTVTTDGDADWTVDTEASAAGTGSSARSGGIGDDGETRLRTSVEGSGTLSFLWKASCEDDPDDTWTWDYLVFEADGTPLAWLDGQTGWREVSVKLGAGTHALVWTFRKDFMDGDDVGEDCGWVDGVAWTPTVAAGDASIPVSWFENQGLVAMGGTAEAAAAADPDGDGHTTADEYVAGTDPNDPDSVLRASIEIVDGRPVVTWTPDLLGERKYRVLGKKTLDSNEDWTDVTDEADLDAAGWRFFKAKVEMK